MRDSKRVDEEAKKERRQRIRKEIEPFVSKQQIILKSYKKINDDGKVEREIEGGERRKEKPVAVTIKLLTNSVQIVSSSDHLSAASARSFL